MTASPKRILAEALREAGALMRRNLGKVGYRYKSKANLVTAVDKKSEALILARILRAFPGHGFLSEERAPRSGAGYTWVIDPLDGTTNFAHGFPVACVSIALVQGPSPVLRTRDVPSPTGRGKREEVKVVLGGVYDPFRDELFVAERGKGATLNGRRVRVSRQPRLQESLLLTGFPYDRAERAAYYVRFYRAFVERCHDVRRSGSAALDMAWTACGRVDGFWEFKLHPWDVAAGLLLVSEAGGAVTDFTGRTWKDLKGYGRQTLASNGRIHGQILRVIRRIL